MEDKKEKLLNLLADQALFGLSEAESAELEQLKKEFPEFKDDYSFEMAASAINLANLEIGEPLPAHLQARVLENAEEFFTARQKEQKALNFEPTQPAADETSRAIIETQPATPWWNWLGWGVAAAACLALAVNLWLTRTQPPQIVQNPETIQTPTPQPNPQQELERFLTSANDIVRASWTELDPKKPKQISGDLVWSNAEQKGYMRFQGLPANDPNKETYQLWIFDENQSDKYPIDGGVFDVTDTGEVVVPVDPKIAVKKPTMFAVTVEKPGGVVVSDRQRLVVIGKV
jgi:anti-sigma-K factor RskA